MNLERHGVCLPANGTGVKVVGRLHSPGRLNAAPHSVHESLGSDDAAAATAAARLRRAALDALGEHRGAQLKDLEVGLCPDGEGASLRLEERPLPCARNPANPAQPRCVRASCFCGGVSGARGITTVHRIL